MARYRSFARTMAGMLRSEDNLLTSGNFPSPRTRAWMKRREELDFEREAIQVGQHNNSCLTWEKDCILWQEFFEESHGDFPGLTKRELDELLRTPKSELSVSRTTEASIIFGRKAPEAHGVETDGEAEEVRRTEDDRTAAMAWDTKWAEMRKEHDKMNSAEVTEEGKWDIPENLNSTSGRKPAWDTYKDTWGKGRGGS